MSRRRGNLLLSALFMAAFLFFLSVALVLTNREDIKYTLFVDDKMRATLAAEGMVDYVLATMRTQQDWESQLSRLNPPFANSGVTASARVLPLSVANVSNNRYSLPKLGADQLAGFELVVTGQSGLVQSQRHLMLEEFRLADSLLQDGRKPHLFAYMGSNFQVLSPNFSWDTVAAPPTVPLPRTLSAGGSPLHFLAAEAGTKPPEIKDYTKITLPSGIVVPGQFGNSTIQIPVGHGGTALHLEDNTWKWVSLPDPGDQLGTVMQQPQVIPPTGEVLTGDGSTLDWNKMTVDWDTIAKSPSQLTVDYSHFSGPRINWYSLTGTVAQIGKGRYVCHGIHYFYSGFRFKNTPQAGGNVRSQGKDASLFHEPCILQFDLASQKWTPLLDLLKVSADPYEEPTIVEGPRPNPNTLLVTAEGVAYTQVAGSQDQTWYEVTAARLQPSSLPHQSQLAVYGNEFLYTEKRWNSDLSEEIRGLNAHDIAAYYPEFLPALNSEPTSQTVVTPTADQEPRLDLYFHVEDTSLTSAGKDLYALVKLITRPHQTPNGTTQSTRCLAHFDGSRWQLLPAGLGLCLPTTSSYRRVLQADYGGGLGPAVSAQRLILAGYPSDRPLLRRYVPVARY